MRAFPYFSKLLHMVAALQIILSVSPLFSQPAIATLQQGVEWGVTHNYDDALRLFDTISSDYPEHPAGPFYRAAIYQSMMLDFESPEWQLLFYQGIDEAIHRAVHQLRIDPNDPWAQFYAGAAYAYKSAQLSRDGKYWPAYRAIQSSLDYLEPLIRQDSTFCDALLGVGTYQYWRSRVTIKFSWLPFFPDRRREGIAKILHASRCSRFSPASAWSNLTWIYIKEKNYDQAIHYARLGLEKYPSSRFFLWPLAEAQFLKADYAAAGETYTALLHSTRNAAHNNGYNELVILWKLAQSCEHLEQTAQAQIWYQEVVACPVDGAASKRAENKKRSAEAWLKKTREAAGLRTQ